MGPLPNFNSFLKMRSGILAAFLITGSFCSCLAQVGQAPAPELSNGIRLYQSNKFKEAASELKKAVKNDKSNAAAWYYFGLALIQNPKLIKDAAKALETATNLRPGWAAAHMEFSYALLLRNRVDEAAREASTALRLDSSLAEAFYVLGITQLRKGASDDALKSAESAIKLQPKFPSAYLLKSQALASFFGDVLLSQSRTSADNRGRYAEAAEALEKYLSLVPNDANKKLLEDWLDNLRFYARSSAPGEPKLIYTGKDVTTMARVLSKPEPSYTEEARKNQVTGTVVFRCVFAADGTIQHLMILRALPNGLTEQALKAARRIKFIPATISGRPVSVFIQLEYNFNLF
jgi:TonB family protein